MNWIWVSHFAEAASIGSVLVFAEARCSGSVLVLAEAGCRSTQSGMMIEDRSDKRIIIISYLSIRTAGANSSCPEVQFIHIVVHWCS